MEGKLQWIPFVSAFLALAKESSSRGQEVESSAQVLPRLCRKVPAGLVGFLEHVLHLLALLIAKGSFWIGPFHGFLCFVLKWRQEQPLAPGRGGGSPRPVCSVSSCGGERRPTVRPRELLSASGLRLLQRVCGDPDSGNFRAETSGS